MDNLPSVIPPSEVYDTSGGYDSEEENKAAEIKNEKEIDEMLDEDLDGSISKIDESDIDDTDSDGDNNSYGDNSDSDEDISKNSNDEQQFSLKEQTPYHYDSANLSSLLKGEEYANHGEDNASHNAVPKDSADHNYNVTTDRKHTSRNMLADASNISEKFEQVQPDKDSVLKNCANFSQEANILDSADLPDNNKDKNSSNVTSPAQSINKDLENELETLKILYNALSTESERLKRQEISNREKYGQEIKTLTSQLACIKAEKNQLSAALKESQNTISVYMHKNNKMTGKLSALEYNLSSEQKAKEAALNELESCKFTIQSLEKQIAALNHSENTFRLQNQNERVINDLKSRHQKDILKLKEEIDILQRNLVEKTNECENQHSKLSEVQEKYEQLRIEKTDIINKLTKDLEDIQVQRQQLLDSGVISEVGTLRRRVTDLQNEKFAMEETNHALKVKIDSLELELKTYESLRNKIEAQINNRQANMEKQSQDSERLKLETSEKYVLAFSKENRTLKDELHELKKKVSEWEDAASSFESLYEKSKKETKELEKKLEELMPGDYIPKLQHKKELNDLKKQLIEIERKYHDTEVKLKELSSSEKKLKEKNKNLKQQLSALQTLNAEDKRIAIEECRKQCLELNDNDKQKLKDEHAAVCVKYENKIAELEKKLHEVEKKLLEVQEQYVQLYQENQSLTVKLDSISKPKEQQEIEKEVELKYEKILQKIKQDNQKVKEYYKTKLAVEIENFKEKWTLQKVEEVKIFETELKQNLDDQYWKCIEKEKKELVLEKEKLILEFEEKNKLLKQQLNDEIQKLTREYEEKIYILRHQSEAEKKESQAKLLESLQKYKKEIKEHQEKHQYEVQGIKVQYERKILELERELEYVKKNSVKITEENKELQMQKEFANQKQEWDKEKYQFISAQSTLKEKLKTAEEAKQKLHEKVKKYSKYVASLEKKHQEKLNKLKYQVNELQQLKEERENKLLELKEEHKQTVLELEKKKKSARKCIGSQTEEIMVSKQSLIKARDLFIQSLRKIIDEMKAYMVISEEKVRKNVSFCYNQLTSKILHDIMKDKPFVPSIAVPRVNANTHTSSSSRKNISPNTMQKHFNERLSDSTPLSKHVSDDVYKRLGVYQSNENSTRAFPVAKSSPDSAIAFEDISFDFIPAEVSDHPLMSTKMPEYYIPGGLFNHHGSIQNRTFPKKVSPISSIK